MTDVQMNKLKEPEKGSQKKQIRIMSSQDDLAILKNLVFVSIISADNDRYTEEVKQEILRRYDLCRERGTLDWEYILEELEDKDRYIKIFENPGE